jgi:MYXO-CTERM domain-containing protein
MSVPNHPNIVEATSTVLSPVTFTEAFGEFAQWRYFVGTRDDGHHFRDGAKWGGAEVKVDASLTLTDLPVTHVSPAKSPVDFGTVYTELSLTGLEPERNVRFGVKGDPSVSWRADVLLIGADGTATVQPITFDDTQSGEAILPGLEAYVTAVLVVSNLGTPDFDPDDPSCTTGLPFFYDISVEDLAVPPTITGVSPSELMAGQPSYVWVSGTGFVDGLVPTLSGDGIGMEGVDFVDPSEFGMNLTVSADAAPGLRDLTVTNPDTLSATLPGALTVKNAAAASNVEPSGGCGCITGRAPTPGGSGTVVLLGLGLGAALRRRRTA